MDIKGGFNGGFNGGKAIDSGGYGCVFSPALKCPNMASNPNGISKLMPNKYADEEYDLLQKFKTALQDIPGYQNFFLLEGVTKCHPEQLTENDLIDYDKCSRLIEGGITQNNINQNLQNVSILNMENGGRSVETFIKNNFKAYIDIMMEEFTQISIIEFIEKYNNSIPREMIETLYM